ncbi:F0F1 ATP synthase subunit B [Georgenia sp. Z1344]|uniref:F0F1 ATP synthase subunit B n=1 Tax=Georgenia sp. Z1344 TaxID=3416706 RepID=UPI003CF17758
MPAGGNVVAEVRDGIDLLIPAWYDIIWSLVVVAVIAFAVVRWGVPRLTGILDERSEKIAEGLRKAEDAEAMLANAEESSASELAEARREAAGIRERANARGKEIEAEAQRKAQDEAERTTSAAERQIEAERRQAAQSLRTDVGSLAVELASRIVGESLADSAAQSRVVDRFLDDLEARSSAGATPGTTRTTQEG